MELEVPEILNIPPKMLPFVTELNDNRYFLAEGGRGSSKSQSFARILLYIGEKNKVRIVCGRETQNKIEDSVYTILKDLIMKYGLNYEVLSNKIRHRTSGTQISFVGFREQGAEGIKGLEGVDILWVDEAQSIAKRTLDVIIPTIRKDNAKVFFSMNRFMRDDAVYEFCAGRNDCLHVKINYFDNPFCPLSLKAEAEVCKNRSEKDYNHIYLGNPLDTADDYLFNFDKLQASFDVLPFGETPFKQRVMGIDFAAQGNDLCVATILDRTSNTHWKLVEQIHWDEPDAMISVGKIVNLIGQHRPDVSILDVGGMGHVVYNRLIEVGMDIKRFDGASTNGIDAIHYVNTRAEAYYRLSDWFSQGWLQVDKKDREVIKELERIKMKFRSDGRRLIQAKVDMKKELGYSPDRADSLMMAVYGTKYLGEANRVDQSSGIVRKSESKRKRTSYRI